MFSTAANPASLSSASLNDIDQIAAGLLPSPAGVYDQKVFLFDRDSTLTVQDGAGRNILYRPAILKHTLQGMANAGHKWGVVSSGAISVADDFAVSLIMRLNIRGINFNESHFAYPLLGSSLLSIFRNRPEAEENKLITPITRLDEFLSAAAAAAMCSSDVTQQDNQTVELFSQLNESDQCTLLYFAIVEGRFDGHRLTNDSKIKEKNVKIAVDVLPDTTFNIQFANTVVTINLLNFLKTRELHSKGKNKLFQVLQALDQLNLQLIVTEELTTLGIVNIQAVPGKHLQRVTNNQNIVMTDDIEDVCKLMSQAGFTSIRAKTSETKQDIPCHFKRLIEEFSVLSPARLKKITAIFKVNHILYDYIEKRIKLGKYKHLMGLFQYDKNDKVAAVTALQNIINGDRTQINDLPKHLGALRNSELGKAIREFVRSGEAHHIVDISGEKTIRNFVAALIENDDAGRDGIDDALRSASSSIYQVGR